VRGSNPDTRKSSISHFARAAKSPISVFCRRYFAVWRRASQRKRKSKSLPRTAGAKKPRKATTTPNSQTPTRPGMPGKQCRQQRETCPGNEAQSTGAAFQAITRAGRGFFSLDFAGAKSPVRYTLPRGVKTDALALTRGGGGLAAKQKKSKSERVGKKRLHIKPIEAFESLLPTPYQYKTAYSEALSFD